MSSCVGFVGQAWLASGRGPTAACSTMAFAVRTAYRVVEVAGGLGYRNPEFVSSHRIFTAKRV
jgi:hypothetical protein